jgi:putative ABC transport system permease protein
MRPDERDIDDEIRGHLALSIKERVDAGEDPDAARLAALREFGYVPAIRESVRRVWFGRFVDAGAHLAGEMRLGLRALLREKTLAVTVIVTLALGIGANAAVVGVARDVLMRPLVNRDADRLVYIRQAAPGFKADNTMFSVPEIADLTACVSSIAQFGDFSTVDLPAVGFGEPRVVQAGVVNGTYFEVMGLQPILGRLLNADDDGPAAAPVVVLTHRFWRRALHGDADVIGRQVRLGSQTATVVGVLEPAIPYPTETEVIANVVTSPHHLGATMVTERTHRMTELFGRLAPGKTVDDARAELEQTYAAMAVAHPGAYPAGASMRITVTPLADQITAPARDVLVVLLAAAAVVFVIACANVASLLLARAVRRENELAVRAALGASRGALRRTLLGESLVLCGAGAVLGVVAAVPFALLIVRYAATFSVRALDVRIHSSLLLVGCGLAMVAAVALAYVPRLPQALAHTGSGDARALRQARGPNARLRAFAATQVALSFVLLATAATLLSSLAAMTSANPGFNVRQVLALDVPMALETPSKAAVKFYEGASRRILALPDVERVAMGSFVPWRDTSGLMPEFPFTGDGDIAEDGDSLPRARLRIVTPGFFDTLGIRRLAGRDFRAEDAGGEPVAVVSKSVARQLFGAADPLGRQVWWVSPMFGAPVPRRIVGVVADVDDEDVVANPAATIYHSFHQLPHAGRLFVQTSSDPYALVGPITRAVRAASAEQPVAHAATLADIRAEVLAPERLSAFVLSAFGGIALLIAVVGVGGVLAFSVSARTREFGVRLASGATPQLLLTRVLGEGLALVAIGLAAGALLGTMLARGAALQHGVDMPAVWPLVGAAAVLVLGALVAALLPAVRAARVDVAQALRSE